MAEIQDVVVVGGGSGGFAAAVRAAQLGGSVTVVEQHHLGGKCMNKNCIPLTFLATAARRMDAIRQAGRYGIQVGEPELDVDALHDEKDLLIESLRMGTREQLTDYGVRLVEGRGKLADRGVVEVEGERIEARNVILATGSISAPLSVAGADLPGVISTEDAVELREIPSHIAVLGHQAWDLEFAQYFRWRGAQVTVITSSRQLIPEADREISQRFAKLLHDAGLVIRRGVEIEAIRPDDGGATVVVLANGQGEVRADSVLASRRLPNSGDLGLPELSVEMEADAVVVDERMQTNVPHLYAIGDVTAGPMWSHKANVEGIVAAENAMGQRSRIEDGSIPRCFHTWPEVAWVGLTEEEAEARDIPFQVGKVPIAINPYAMILGETAGAVKVVAGEKYGKILGVHMMAPGAMDLINVVSVAMLSEATVTQLMDFVPAHPSIGEALVDAAMDVEKRSLHLPKW